MEPGPILLVEDTRSDEVLTLEALASGGVRTPVVVVRDGAAALDYVFRRGAYADRAGPDLPQAVLLDLGLPKIGGLDVLRELRAHEATRRLPVVILTSSNEERDIVQSYDLGANSYVRKPVAFDDFMHAVREMGLYWARINQRPP